MGRSGQQLAPGAATLKGLLGVALPTGPIIPPTSGPLDAGQPQPLVPPCPHPRSQRPPASGIRDLGRSLGSRTAEEDDLARRFPAPLPQPCQKAAPTRCRCAPPRRPRGAAAAGAGDGNLRARYRRGLGLGAGRGGGWSWYPKLTCSPAGGVETAGRGERASPGQGERRSARVPALPLPHEPPGAAPSD